MTIEIIKISCQRVQGYEFIPNFQHNKGIIITFGGSEGSCNFDSAYQIANQGYHVLALYFFGKVNLPSTLAQLELTFFDEVLAYPPVMKREGPLTLLGGSRGAELALLLATYYQEIDNLVLYSSSAYIYSGVEQKPSWLYQVMALPFIHFSWQTRLNALLPPKKSLVTLFRRELVARGDLAQWEIQVNKFKGSLLMFVGRDDQTWPSLEMAESIQTWASSAKEVVCVTYRVIRLITFTMMVVVMMGIHTRELKVGRS